MLDEVISFYSFLGLNFELTAALAVLQVILIIFVVAFIGYFVTKNYIVKQLRKTLHFVNYQSYLGHRMLYIQL